MKGERIIVPEGCTQVLLHACCAPCSSAIVEWLLAHEIEPIIYYYNPNIYPFEEYEIRKSESKRHADSLGIQWIDADRKAATPALCKEKENSSWDAQHAEWLFSVKGLEQEPECGKRCSACFYHRLFSTARKAQELDIPFFATTLASSRWKNLDQVNAAGLRAAEMVNKYPSNSILHEPVHFWAQNWRKDGLQERRNTLLKEYGFYNQQYCGCEFSMRR